MSLPPAPLPLPLDEHLLPELLYLDDAVIAIHKPSGMHCVPGRGDLAHGSAVQRVQQHHPDAKVVHRLDMATSGILLLARGLVAQRALNHQFERREIQKHYVAVVDGLMTQDQGDIDAPLIADWPQRPRQKVDPVQGKPSQTHYQVIERDLQARCTHVALTPVTGRSHQLRVHLWHVGHPILGDPLYAPPEVAGRSKRLLLHAQSITFDHPFSGERVTLTCPATFWGLGV